jgi:hypothetical protein
MREAIVAISPVILGPDRMAVSGQFTMAEAADALASAGHYPMFEVAVALATSLDRFLGRE